MFCTALCWCVLERSDKELKYSTCVAFNCCILCCFPLLFAPLPRSWLFQVRISVHGEDVHGALLDQRDVARCGHIPTPHRQRGDDSGIERCVNLAMLASVAYML